MRYDNATLYNDIALVGYPVYYDMAEKMIQHFQTNLRLLDELSLPISRKQRLSKLTGMSIIKNEFGKTQIKPMHRTSQYDFDFDKKQQH